MNHEDQAPLSLEELVTLTLVVASALLPSGNASPLADAAALVVRAEAPYRRACDPLIGHHARWPAAEDVEAAAERARHHVAPMEGLALLVKLRGRPRSLDGTDLAGSDELDAMVDVSIAVAEAIAG